MRFSFLLVVFSTSDLLVYGQADTVTRPSLNNHEFSPVSTTSLPFVNTYFSTIMGYGSTLNFSDDWLEIDGEPVLGLAGTITFLDMRLAYHQRVRNWMAAYIHLGIAARVGTEAQSLLAQGLTTIENFEIGWKFKLFEGEKSAFSAIVELKKNNGRFVNILGYVQDVLDSIQPASITQNIPVLSMGTGLQFAYGFSEVVGIYGQFEISYGETYIRGRNGYSFVTGGALSLDFYPRYKLPIGLVFNYTITSQPELVYVAGKIAQIFMGKIMYSKHSDFALGLEFSLMKVPLLNDPSDPTVRWTALSTWYYF